MITYARYDRILWALAACSWRTWNYSLDLYWSVFVQLKISSIFQMWFNFTFQHIQNYEQKWIQSQQVIRRSSQTDHICWLISTITKKSMKLLIQNNNHNSMCVWMFLVAVWSISWQSEQMIKKSKMIQNKMMHIITTSLNKCH